MYRYDEVEERADGWYVRLRLDGDVESDKYNTKDLPGISNARKLAADGTVLRG